MDESTGQRVKCPHDQLEPLVRTKDLKRLYPSDLQAQPKPKATQREENARRSNEETHQRIQSAGKFRPEGGLPTTSISSDRGIEDQANTQSPVARPETIEEAEAEPTNVAIVRAAERSTLPAQVTESVANTGPSVTFINEKGVPINAEKQENGSYVFEGKPYTSDKALVRYLKSSGRSCRLADAAELDDEAEGVRPVAAV